MTSPELDKARRSVEKEFEQFREEFGRVLEAVGQVSSAGPFDDVHGLLERLEDTVRDVRTGSAFGSGAKGHRSALAKYEKVASQPS